MTRADRTGDPDDEPGDPSAASGANRALVSALHAASDQQLLELVRAGQDTAFAELFGRHAAAVRGYASRFATDPAEAEDIAAEAFFRVLQAVRRGAGPVDQVRGYLLTVVRRLAAEWHGRSRDVPVADEELNRRLDPVAEPAANRADQHLITRAFASLPQRWRSVLWRVEVEGQRPAVVAPQFGLSPNATAALARRARQGLRAAYLQAHVSQHGVATDCQAVRDRLGAYTADQVRGAEAARMRAHLRDCASCRALHAELTDVFAGLRRYAGAVLPPVVGGALLAVRLWAGRLSGGRAVVALRAARAVAAGARVKIAVAATSVALVGGFGVTAAPLLLHAGPSVRADGGQVLWLPGPASGVSTGSGGAAPLVGSATGSTTTDRGSAADAAPSTARDRAADPAPTARSAAPAANSPTSYRPMGATTTGQPADPGTALTSAASPLATDPVTTDPTTDPSAGHAPAPPSVPGGDDWPSWLWTTIWRYCPH